MKRRTAAWGVAGLTLLALVLAYGACYAFWMTAYPMAPADLWRPRFYLLAGLLGLVAGADLFLLRRLFRR